jgi:hypothetical protein
MSSTVRTGGLCEDVNKYSTTRLDTTTYITSGSDAETLALLDSTGKAAARAHLGSNLARTARNEVIVQCAGIRIDEEATLVHTKATSGRASYTAERGDLRGTR